LPMRPSRMGRSASPTDVSKSYTWVCLMMAVKIPNLPVTNWGGFGGRETQRQAGRGGCCQPDVFLMATLIQQGHSKAAQHHQPHPAHRPVWLGGKFSTSQ
jgi:hypothetical protein